MFNHKSYASLTGLELALVHQTLCVIEKLDAFPYLLDTPTYTILPTFTRARYFQKAALSDTATESVRSRSVSVACGTPQLTYGFPPCKLIAATSKVRLLGV